MKKLPIILMLFTFSFSFAFAQDASSSATSSASSTKLSRIEQRNEKIRNYTAQMQERLNVIVGNLERMALRVETQINKLTSSTATGTDLSAAQIKLADAKKKIEELKTAISNLTVKVEDIIKSKTPKTAFYNVRKKLVKVFIAKIKVIHKELLDSVKLAKKETARIKAQNATSTQDVKDWKINETITVFNVVVNELTDSGFTGDGVVNGKKITNINFIYGDKTRFLKFEGSDEFLLENNTIRESDITYFKSHVTCGGSSICTEVRRQVTVYGTLISNNKIRVDEIRIPFQ